MTQALPATAIPGYVAGTWHLDPAHTEVGFVARHLMVAKVRGRFTDVAGTLVTAESPLDSQVEATIQLTSITTNNDQRDNHIRSADFFDVEKFPTMTYKSTGVRTDGDDFLLDGELTLKGVTRPITLQLELGGFGPDAWGGTRAGFTATGSLNRSDYGVDIQLPMDGGGVVVGEKITITIDAEAVLAK